MRNRYFRIGYIKVPVGEIQEFYDDKNNTMTKRFVNPISPSFGVQQF